MSVSLPRPPAHVEPFVRVLGHELAVRFLLEFGGAELYLARDPKGRSQVEKLIGADMIKALQEIAPDLAARVPLAKPWVAQTLKALDPQLSHAAIARKLHVTDVTVRGYMNKRLPGSDLRKTAPDTLPLFPELDR